MLNEVGIVHFVLGFVLGHLCGSIPSGLWLVQALHGIDIRNYGSKNIGTTNVFRTVGRIPGFMGSVGFISDAVVADYRVLVDVGERPHLDVCA